MALKPTVRAAELALRKTFLYYDRGIILINKPANTVCQLSHGEGPAQYEKFNIILEGIRRKLRMPEMPFPVHRLDKNTTGALLLARTKVWAEKLQQQFREGTIDKTYIALVHGGKEQFSQSRGTIEAPLRVDLDGRVRLDPRGKACVTKWEVLGSSERAPLSLLRLKLVTGHKHQLRIHLAKCLNAPILGDNLYTKNERKQDVADVLTVRRSMYLHASELSLIRFNKGGPKKRFIQNFRVPAPMHFQVICRDAKIPLDMSILKGEMFLGGEPWRNPHHLLQEDDTCWVSDHLLPQLDTTTREV